MNHQSFSQNTNPHAVTWLLDHLDMMPIEIYEHPDVRIFTRLLSNDISCRNMLLSHPHVFYYTTDKKEYKLYKTFIKTPLK
jgi:hypothetical protein